MKICQLCAVDFTLKHFLLALIDQQMKEGNEVISVCSDGPDIKSIRDQGYNVHNISISRSANPITILYSIYKLFIYFRKESFDIVHVHTPVAALVARISAYFARVPIVIYTAHGFYFHDDMTFFKKSFHIFLEKFLGRLTDLLFTQSREDEKTAINLNIMPKEKIFAIGNGVNINSFNPEKFEDNSKLRKHFSIPKSAFVIVMISPCFEEKGII